MSNVMCVTGLTLVHVFAIRFDRLHFERNVIKLQCPMKKDTNKSNQV